MLEKVRKGSFFESGIERIVIPKSVLEIQDSAFRNCTYLRDVVFKAGSALKKIGNDAFRSCKNLKNI